MRFPIGLRLNVKSLVVSNIQIEQEILRPLLTNTVQRIHVLVESAGDFECAMLKDAEILKVHDGGTGFIRPPMIINLTNLKANIDVVNWTVEDFMKVVRNWVEVVKKKVGTSYKFTLILEENITQHLIESINEQYGEAKEIGDLSMTIPTKYGSSINVSITILDYSYNEYTYEIKFTVVPKELDLPV
ncbi:hypothetical protein GCK72_004139 [Caenorhabditis remanei]|uniref:DUF38 domain-containing protein n=1 Tax=Caenorhabditis remanei TaxID=31234 RepID=A0A6A5HCU0_CAERE|nr:hypothetical protein GCK72_004139 [Caenorhabditis remanei]KAF1764192.1 hypothetical protein GCK72_004139 [Caenorhabditis remanei]